MSDRRFEALLAIVAITAAVVGFGRAASDDSGWTPGVREPGDVRVMTWNVGGSNGEFGHALHDDDVAHVASVIRRFEPDVVLLQETGGRAQVDRLRDRLGGAWRRLVSRGDRPVAILANGRLRRWGPRNGWRLAFARVHPSGSAVPRGLLVGCIHADAYDARRRNRHVGMAVGILSTDSRGSPAILAGDFNLDVDLGKKRELFTDDDHRDVETYNYVAARFDDVGIGSGSTAEPDRRLDYVFARGFVARGAGPVRGCRVGDMDHDPVVADLRIGSAAESSGRPKDGAASK